MNYPIYFEQEVDLKGVATFECPLHPLHGVFDLSSGVSDLGYQRPGKNLTWLMMTAPYQTI